MKIGVVDGRLLRLLEDSIKEDSKYYSKPVIDLFSDVCLADLSSKQYQSYIRYDGEGYNIVKVYKKFYSRVNYYLVSLDLKHQLVLRWRYGLGLERRLNYNEIASLLGISASTVSGIECNALDELRSICVYYTVGGYY